MRLGEVSSVCSKWSTAAKKSSRNSTNRDRPGSGKGYCRVVSWVSCLGSGFGRSHLGIGTGEISLRFIPNVSDHSRNFPCVILIMGRMCILAPLRWKNRHQSRFRSLPVFPGLRGIPGELGHPGLFPNPVCRVDKGKSKRGRIGKKRGICWQGFPELPSARILGQKTLDFPTKNPFRDPMSRALKKPFPAPARSLCRINFSGVPDLSQGHLRQTDHERPDGRNPLVHAQRPLFPFQFWVALSFCQYG